MDIIFQQIIPFHRLTYIKEFIERSFKYQTGSSPMIRKINRSFGILSIQSLQFLYQFFFVDFNNLKIDPIIDYIRISCLPREVYLFLMGICALSIFFLYYLYCGPFKEINEILYQILILQQNTFFVHKKYGSKLVYRWTQQFTFCLVNLFQGFMVVVGEFSKIR